MKTLLAAPLVLLLYSPLASVLVASNPPDLALSRVEIPVETETVPLFTDWTGASTVNAYAVHRGNRFTVGPHNVVVTHLGYYDEGGDGLLESHAVGIYSSTRARVVEKVIPAGADLPLEDGFRYLELSSPIVLGAGRTYLIAGFLGSTNHDQTLTEIPSVGTSELFTFVESDFIQDPVISSPWYGSVTDWMNVNLKAHRQGTAADVQVFPGLQVSGTPGAVIRLEATNDPAGTDWTRLTALTLATVSDLVSDRSWTDGAPRFYRALALDWTDALPPDAAALDGSRFELRLLVGGTGEDVGAIYLTFANGQATVDFRDVGGVLQSPSAFAYVREPDVVDLNIVDPDDANSYLRFVLTFASASAGSYVGYYGPGPIPDAATADEIDRGTFMWTPSGG